LKDERFDSQLIQPFLLLREKFAANALSVRAEEGFKDEEEGGTLAAAQLICSRAHLYA